MKILIIRTVPSCMEVKNSTYNLQEVGLAKALVRRGNICDILFWTDQKEKKISIPVDDCGKVRVFYKKGKAFLKNAVYTGCEGLFAGYDILQPAEYNQMQSWLLAKNHPEKTIIYHGPYYSPFNKRYNLMCRAFDAVFLPLYRRQGTRFLVKSRMAEEFLAEKGIAEEHIAAVGVGMDAQMLSSGSAECREPFYRAMKSDAASLKLLYIGRLEERRNIPFLFDVLAEVLRREPGAKLYMIGNGDREYVKSAFSHAESLGIRESIVWKKEVQQKDLSGIYQLADFFLLPTEYEIFGMVLLESMYYRNVVLTTRNGGSSTLMESGADGFIMDSLNAARWAETILSIQKDPEKKNEIGEKAHKKISDEYTWDRRAGFFEEQYRKLLRDGS